MIKKTTLIITCLLLMVLTFNNTAQAQSSFNMSHHESESELIKSGPSYGDTKIVDVDSPVPNGWVIWSKNTFSMVIKCVIGASYGDTMTVSIESPVPYGWVIWAKNTFTMVIKYRG